jgi:hypothetical protein
MRAREYACDYGRDVMRSINTRTFMRVSCVHVCMMRRPWCSNACAGGEHCKETIHVRMRRYVRIQGAGRHTHLIAANRHHRGPCLAPSCSPRRAPHHVTVPWPKHQHWREGSFSQHSWMAWRARPNRPSRCARDVLPRSCRFAEACPAELLPRRFVLACHCGLN